MDVAAIRDALAAANYKMAFSISLSRYGGPWLDNLLKNPPADLETLIRRTFQLYLSVPQTRGRVYDWAASFSQTFFWRFMGAWQFGLFTPLVERSVAALRAYENATIDADIIFTELLASTSVRRPFTSLTKRSGGACGLSCTNKCWPRCPRIGRRFSMPS